MKREPVCTVKGCPAPRDPDWHKPWCGHGLEGHHHHVPKRSQGGKRIVAFLCPKCHDEVDNGISLGNMVWEDMNGREHYLLWDVAKGNLYPLIDRVLEAGNAAAEAEVAKLQGSRVTGEKSLACGSGSHNRGAGESAVNSLRGESRASSSAAASPASGREEEGDGIRLAATCSGSDVVHGGNKRPRDSLAVTVTHPNDSSARRSLDIASGESSAAEPPVRGALPGPAGDSRLVPSPTAAPPSVFDLSSWCQQGMSLVYFGLSLKDNTDTWRFALGDWFNEGETILSDEAYGYLRPFKDETVRQYAWVAGTVSRDTRVLELSWSFHRAVAGRPPPEQKLLLAKAKDENLTTRQFGLVIHGPPEPKVKRWTLEELRELAKEHWELVKSGPNAREAEGGEQFLDWLEAK